jgi:heavy metal response regulator
LRILITEDNKPLLNILEKRLTEEGYSVDACSDGDDGQYCANTYDYDLAVLDIMLPHVSGIEILKNIKAKNPTVPAILLTAKDSIGDRVKGLDSGADDYLIKPFSFDELLARIRAQLRRSCSIAENTLLLSDLSVDIVGRKVMRGDQEIDLTIKEYAVLEYMLRNKGRVLTRSQIADHVWNYSFDSGTNIVDVYIRYLRKKIDDDYKIKLIHTVRGMGYVMKDENL